jgi:hypothetical protein
MKRHPRRATSENRGAPVMQSMSNARRKWRIIEVMNPSRAVHRRYLPSSPFNNRPAPLPIEQYAVDDQVTHDRYGLGMVIGVESDIAVLVDFGPQQARITTPFTKLTKL